MARKNGWRARITVRSTRTRGSRQKALLVLLMALGVVGGALFAGDSRLGIGPWHAPTHVPSSNASLANPPNGIAQAAAIKKAAQVAAARPAPIHGNTWTTRSTATIDAATGASAIFTPFAHASPNGDGTWTADFHLIPTYRQTANGWLPIDPGVLARSDPTQPFSAENGVRPIRFGVVGSRLVEIELDKGPVTISAAGLSVGVPIPWQNGVMYASVANGTDLRYTVTASGVKEEIVLSSAASPTSFSFHISDPASQLGAVHATSDGGFVFDALLDGQTQIKLTPPTAFEAASVPNGQSAVENPGSAHEMVTRAGDGFDVTESVDPTWLRGRPFPIVLDPPLTFIDGNTQYALATYDNTSGGCQASCPSVNVGYDLGVGWYTPYLFRHSYFRYDLQSSSNTSQTVISPGSTINSALFSPAVVGCWEDSSSDYHCNNHSYSYGFSSMTHAWQVGDSWQSLVNNTDVGNYFAVGNQSNFPDPYPNHFLWNTTFPTSLVQGWFDNPSTNKGFAAYLPGGPGNSYCDTCGGPVWQNSTYCPSGQTCTTGPDAALIVTYTPAPFGPVNWGFQDSAQNPPLYPQNGNPAYLGPTDTGVSNMWVYVANQSSIPWPANGNIRVGYHIYDSAASTDKCHDSNRTLFNTSVAPGNGVWVNATINAFSTLPNNPPYCSGPLPDGSYVLRWDIVNEGAWWASDYNPAYAADFPILVTTPPTPKSPSDGTTQKQSVTPTLTASTCTSNGTANNLCNSYQFQLSTDPNFGGYILSSGWLSTPSWAIPSSEKLDTGTTYHWRVMGRATNNTTPGPSTGWSSPFSFKTMGVPTAPTGVTADPNPVAASIGGPPTPSVRLSWTPPLDDGGQPITDYQVTPYLDWHGQPPIAATSTSLTLTGLVDGGNYSFTVSAENGVGLGLPSDFTAPVVPSGVPGAPGNVTAIAGNQQVEVSWAPPADGATDVTGYQVTTYLVTSNGLVPGAIVNIAGAATSALITQGIVNGVNYTFGVASVNSSGGFIANPLKSPPTMCNCPSTPSAQAPGASVSLDSSTYARGSSSTVTVKATASTSAGDSNDTLTITMPPAVNGAAPFDPLGSSIAIQSTPGQTCGAGGVVCSVTNSQITVRGLAVPGGTSGAVVTATLRTLGLDAGCGTWSVGATVTLAGSSTGGTGSASAAICDGGLGIQPWWSFISKEVGPGGLAQVNAADGNLVFSQSDSTIFQLHGHLKLGTTRSYNSEEIAATSSEPLGAGWTTSWVGAGDSVGGTALRISGDEHVEHGQVVTLINDSGARISFAPTDLSTPIDVTGLAGSTGALAPLTPTTIKLDAGPPTYNRMCVTTVYASEAGVHASMWRYVESTTGGCSGLVGSYAKVLGYATMTLDRVRREFNAAGQLLSVRDALGNEVDYSYDTSGRLSRVGEIGGSGRAYTLTYTTWTSPNGTATEIDVTDPAGRLTKYQDDTGNHLVNVINPDTSVLQYTYSGCAPPSSTQLCSAQDPQGGVASFQYTAASTGPPQVTKITARNGTATTLTYAAGQTTADTGGERRLFTKIDTAGRVAELDEGSTANHWWRRTMYTWDGAGCRQPDSGDDNNLCAIARLALNAKATPDRSTIYVYSDEGRLLSSDESASPSHVVTTSSFAAQYVEADGTVRSFADAIVGANKVNSGAAGRRDSATVFVISDLTGALSPNGNAAAGTSGYQPYQTSYTLDANPSVGAGLPLPSSGVCPGNHANTGSLCTTTAPSKDGTNATVTTYTYDGYGQRTSMTTPDENAKSQSGTAYTYTYFQDGDTDLSGTTKAGGWLRAVTDPTGEFVAFGYDAAGNVVRTWDRNATHGHSAASFPGTLCSPPSSSCSLTVNGYSETLYGSGSSTAFSTPWRYVMSRRDALGNTTTYKRDHNGNTLGVRPPRGNQVSVAEPKCPPAVGTYDICSTYNSSDQMLTIQQPVEAALNGSPRTANTYDQYGNLESTTNPDGNVTTYGYDLVNRQTTKNWTRGPVGSVAGVTMLTPDGCRISKSSDKYIPANHILCTTTTIYDGVDNVTSVISGETANDGTGQVVETIYQYDAVHRVVATYTPRYDGTLRMLETATVYDQDGNVTETCPPREFTEGQKKCAAGGYFSTYKTYNPADLLLSSSDYLGYTATSGTLETTSQFAYDADGNAVTAFDATNSRVLIYNVLDRLTATEVFEGMGRNFTPIYHTTSYAYDYSGNRILTSAPPTAAGTRNTLVTYDANNRPVDTVVAAVTSSGVPTTQYSQIGTTDANGAFNIHTRKLYDPDGNVVATFSPRAFTASATAPNPEFMVRVDYDADGRPTTQYVPRYDTSATTASPFDTAVSPLVGPMPAWGQASQASECPAGATPKNIAGVPGYPSTTGVCISAIEYDAAGRVTQQLLPTAGGDPNSLRFDAYTYTDDGLVYQQSTPDPATGTTDQKTTTFQYDVGANLLSTTDPLGLVTSQVWSRDHHTLNTQNPPGLNSGVPVTHTTAAVFDANGNQTSVIDALGATTLTAYTTNNRRQSVATPSGGASLQPSGGGSSTPDSGPYVTSYTYDTAGNLTSTTSPNANAGVTANPAMVDPDNPNRVATTYTYTLDHLLSTTILPPSGNPYPRHIDNGYDAAGQRIGQHTYEAPVGLSSGSQYTEGGTLSYQYYLDGRLQADVARDSGATPSKTFQYDADGNLTTWQGGSGTSTYYIDGTLRSTTDFGYTSQWSYDGAGRMATLTTVTASGGLVLDEAAHYTNYGQTDALRAGQYNGGNSGEVRTYDADGRLTKTTQSNGDTLNYSLNPDSTLASLSLNQVGTGSQLANWSYMYDANYRAIATTESAPNLVASLTYSYYPDGRLQQYGLSNDGSDSYITYDHSGNRTSWTPPFSHSGSSTSSYNPDDSLKQTANTGTPSNTMTMTYDVDGRLKSDACTTYAYDGFDRMIAATATAGRDASLCGATPAASTTYGYDNLDRQGAHTDATGTWNNYYATMGAVTAAALHGDSAQHMRVFVNDNSGTPSQVLDETGNSVTPQWLASDGRGSLGAVTVGDGSSACLLLYDVYGSNLLGQSATNPCIGDGSQFTQLGYHFAQRDPTTGDYTFGTRTYDPSKAAFATPDSFQPGSTARDVSIGSDPLTQDRYAYVNGDPVNRIDPSGHCYDPCDQAPPYPCQLHPCVSPPSPPPSQGVGPSNNGGGGGGGCSGPHANALGCNDGAPTPPTVTSDCHSDSCSGYGSPYAPLGIECNEACGSAANAGTNGDLYGLTPSEIAFFSSQEFLKTFITTESYACGYQGDQAACAAMSSIHPGQNILQCLLAFGIHCDNVTSLSNWGVLASAGGRAFKIWLAPTSTAPGELSDIGRKLDKAGTVIGNAATIFGGVMIFLGNYQKHGSVVDAAAVAGGTTVAQTIVGGAAATACSETGPVAVLCGGGAAFFTGAVVEPTLEWAIYGDQPTPLQVACARIFGPNC